MVGGTGTGNGASATLSIFTIRNNTAGSTSYGYGGGLYVGGYGTVSLTDCTVSDNIASKGTGSGDGAGLYIAANGTVNLMNCTVSGNTSGYGGGLEIRGTANLTNCMIINNSTRTSTSGGPGGGLYISNGAVTLINCTVSGNTTGIGTTGSSGGGIYIISGLLDSTNCTVSGNTAIGTSSLGGGIYSSGTTTRVNLTNCTVSGNNTTGSGGGGGIYSSGITTLINTTISGNSTGTGNGGGLYVNSGTVAMTNCTIAGNRTDAGTSGLGGGIYITTGTVTLKNTIVLGNTDTTSSTGDDIYRSSGTVTSQGYNIVQGLYNCTFVAAGDVVLGTGTNSGLTWSSILVGDGGSPAKPLLAWNGGLTQTIALLGYPENPAIAAIPEAAGSNTWNGAPASDQRGLARATTAQGNRDVGAYEATMSLSDYAFQDGLPEGSVIAILSESALVNPEFSLDGVSFDNSKFTIVQNGSTNELRTNDPFTVAVNSSYIIYVTETGGYGQPMKLMVINDAPSINNVPAGLSTDEDMPLYITGINITDADITAGDNADVGKVQITLSVSHGVFSLAQIEGLTFNVGDGIGDASMTFKGLLADVNSALATITYTPTLNYFGSDLLNIAVNDLGNYPAPALTDSNMIAITVVSVNDAAGRQRRLQQCYRF